MQLLDSTGIGLMLKKGYLKIDGEFEISNGYIYLQLAEDETFKAKTTSIYQLPHNINLSGRLAAFVDVNDELYLNGTVGSPTILMGNWLPAINLRIRMEKDIALERGDYIIRLAIAKLSQ